MTSDWILGRHGQPTFVFAHQDDELVLAGVIQRIAGDDARGAFIWWTNGDGLAAQAGQPRERYAALRTSEAAGSLRCLGASERRKVDLGCSEVENYRQLAALAGPLSARRQALEHFQAEADRVEQALRATDPDRVFVLAWQGGHPEHDLVHLMTARAVRRLRKETGRPIPLIQSPAYEYLIACPLRFKPWYRGDVRTLELTKEELTNKLAAFRAHASQEALFTQFRRVIAGLGLLSRLRGRPFDSDAFLAKEQLGVVDPQLDYGASTHRFDRLNYIGDHFQGTPVRFGAMIRPLARALLLAS